MTPWETQVTITPGIIDGYREVEMLWNLLGVSLLACHQIDMPASTDLLVFADQTLTLHQETVLVTVAFGDLAPTELQVETLWGGERMPLSESGEAVVWLVEDATQLVLIYGPDDTLLATTVFGWHDNLTAQDFSIDVDRLAASLLWASSSFAHNTPQAAEVEVHWHQQLPAFVDFASALEVALAADPQAITQPPQPLLDTWRQAQAGAWAEICVFAAQVGEGGACEAERREYNSGGDLIMEDRFEPDEAAARDGVVIDGVFTDTSTLSLSAANTRNRWVEVLWSGEALRLEPHGYAVPGIINTAVEFGVFLLSYVEDDLVEDRGDFFAELEDFATSRIVSGGEAVPFAVTVEGSDTIRVIGPGSEGMPEDTEALKRTSILTLYTELMLPALGILLPTHTLGEDVALSCLIDAADQLATDGMDDPLEAIWSAFDANQETAALVILSEIVQALGPCAIVGGVSSEHYAELFESETVVRVLKALNTLDRLAAVADLSVSVAQTNAAFSASPRVGSYVVTATASPQDEETEEKPGQQKDVDRVMVRVDHRLSACPDFMAAWGLSDGCCVDIHTTIESGTIDESSWIQGYIVSGDAWAEANSSPIDAYDEAEPCHLTINRFKPLEESVSCGDFVPRPGEPSEESFPGGTWQNLSYSWSETFEISNDCLLTSEVTVEVSID